MRSAVELLANAPRDVHSKQLKKVGDARLAEAKVCLGKWKHVASTYRGPETSRGDVRVVRRSRRLKAPRPAPLVDALGLDGPLLDFCGGDDLARLEQTCRAAWLPSPSRGWLGPAEASALRTLTTVARPGSHS